MSAAVNRSSRVSKDYYRNPWLLFVITFASINFCIARLHFCPENPVADLAQMIAGHAATPFQYRILIPLAARSMMLLVGQAGDATDPVKIFFFSEFIFTFLSLIVALKLLERLRFSFVQSCIFIMALFFVLNVNYVFSDYLNFRYIYDMPALLFALLLIGAMYDGRIRAYYVLFPLALLNRETAVYLSVLFFLTQRKPLGLNSALRHCLAQIAIFVLIKIGLSFAFSGNGGPGALSFYENDYDAAAHHVENLRLITNATHCCPVKTRIDSIG